MGRGSERLTDVKLNEGLHGWLCERMMGDDQKEGLLLVIYLDEAGGRRPGPVRLQAGGL